MPSLAPTNTAGVRAPYCLRKSAYPAPGNTFDGGPEYEILEFTISPSRELPTRNPPPSPLLAAIATQVGDPVGAGRAAKVQRQRSEVDVIPGEPARHRDGVAPWPAHMDIAARGRHPVELLRRPPKGRQNLQRLAGILADRLGHDIATPIAGVEPGRIHDRALAELA